MQRVAADYISPGSRQISPTIPGIHDVPRLVLRPNVDLVRCLQSLLASLRRLSPDDLTGKKKQWTLEVALLHSVRFGRSSRHSQRVSSVGPG